MRRCVLVIEKAASSVHCAAFAPGSVESADRMTYGPGMAEAAVALASDLRAKGLKPVKTLLSIHSSLLSLRIADIPIGDRKKLREVAALQAEDLFAGPPEGLLIDAVPLANGRAAVVAVAKDALEAQLKALGDAGISVDWAGPALLSKGLVLKRLEPGDEASALVDDDSITVAASGAPIFFKHLETAEDLALSLSALEADGVSVRRFYSTASSGFASACGLAVRDSGVAERVSLAALAAEYAGGLKGNVDFMRWRTDPKALSAVRSRAAVAWVLACALVLAWGAYSFFRYQNVKAEMSAIDASIERGYQALFPGDKTRNPEYALEVRLKELSVEREAIGSRVDALPALLALSEAARARSVRVSELEAVGAVTTVVSEAASFEEAAAFREAASKGGFFEKVSITETGPGPSGRVRFMLSAERGER